VGVVKINISLKGDIFEEILATALGLDKYQDIISHKESSSITFRRKFNAYFRVRRNPSWQESFYGIFNSLRNSDKVTFELIIQTLYQKTGQVEPSFSSKMLHILNPEMPIWDQYVLKNLGFKTSLKGSPEEKINEAIDVYDSITKFYFDYLNSKDGIAFVKEFNLQLPKYSHFSDIKKLDAILWKIRAY
jgi:hypothetical protein